MVMSKQTVLNVKIDSDLKAKAQAVAKDLGVPMSIVVTSNLREFVRNRSLTISDPPRLKPMAEKELLAISKEAKSGNNVSPRFNDLVDAFKWLDS
jgi:addiction module RelB/DinJ family antitoxin